MPSFKTGFSPPSSGTSGATDSVLMLSASSGSTQGAIAPPGLVPAMPARAISVASSSDGASREVLNENFDSPIQQIDSSSTSSRSSMSDRLSASKRAMLEKKRELARLEAELAEEEHIANIAIQRQHLIEIGSNRSRSQKGTSTPSRSSRGNSTPARSSTPTRDRLQGSAVVKKMQHYFERAEPHHEPRRERGLSAVEEIPVPIDDATASSFELARQAPDPMNVENEVGRDGFIQPLMRANSLSGSLFEPGNMQTSCREDHYQSLPGSGCPTQVNVQQNVYVDNSVSEQNIQASVTNAQQEVIHVAEERHVAVLTTVQQQATAEHQHVVALMP